MHLYGSRLAQMCNMFVGYQHVQWTRTRVSSVEGCRIPNNHKLKTSSFSLSHFQESEDIGSMSLFFFCFCVDQRWLCLCVPNPWCSKHPCLSDEQTPGPRSWRFTSRPWHSSLLAWKIHVTVFVVLLLFFFRSMGRYGKTTWVCRYRVKQPWNCEYFWFLSIKFGAISGCTLKIFFVDWTPLKYVVCVLFCHVLAWFGVLILCMPWWYWFEICTPLALHPLIGGHPTTP